MIAIINYGSGNIAAIENIYRQLKVPYVVTSNLEVLAGADRYILPGVGAFDATMRCLNSSGMVATLNEQVLVNRKKVLGICVGMQILAESSEEGTLAGLGWIAGRAADVSATVKYGNHFPCALAHANRFGMQFHPEKSHANGAAVFRNFAEL